MIYPISQKSVTELNNPAFKRYAQRYLDIELQTQDAIRQYGLSFESPFAEYEKQRVLRDELQSLGATFSNNGKSIHIQWLSSACQACRTGEGSYTTFLSLKCHRDCYFCFNPNQENYQEYQHTQREACEEVESLAYHEVPLTHIALTGGEPLLYRQESIEFFERVQQRLPQVHSRLYTAGDPLDKKTAQKLAQAGLKEIRFSIKIDDPADKIEKILHRIALAREIIPSVMVEMPVIPGSYNQMCILLNRLDEIGIDGINLLEFCFPLTNSEEYQSRGFELKNPPYEVYYNYWYAGGLAVAQSETLCLQLVKFALTEKLKLGVHYCSLENKHTGQVYQSNAYLEANPHFHFSTKDYFFKSAKVFGDDLNTVTDFFRSQQIPFDENLLHPFIQFHPQFIEQLKAKWPSLEVAITSHIAEADENGDPLIKEVKIDLTTPALFSFNDFNGGSCDSAC